MLKELAKEKWSNKVNVISVGATKDEGGSRTTSIKIGGQSTLPFMFNDGEIPYRPVIVGEVWDSAPADWPASLNSELSDVYADPLAYAI